MNKIHIFIVVFYAFCVARVLPTTFPRLASVANFGTAYFLLKIKFLAKREREFTTKFAIAPNVCWQMPFFFLLSFYILFCRLNNSDIL